MARITSQKAAEQIGNQFDLVLAASQRAREIKAGSAPRVKTNNGALITAIKEIEEGKYTRKEWLETIPRTEKSKFT
jgi:DNA-directed RNA polymerase omega subunit